MKMAVMLIIMIIVAHVAALVSPSPNTIHHLFASSKYEFQSTLPNHVYPMVESLYSNDVCFTSPIQNTPVSYYLNMSIGTSKKPFFVSQVLATATKLTWTQCEPCKHCLHQTTPIFNPNKSTSYRKVGCSDNMCNPNITGVRSTCEKYNVCGYKYTYADDETNGHGGGVIARDTFTFAGNVSIQNLYFGCGNDNYDDTNVGYPGLLGLGRGTISFVSQMKVPHFSYHLTSFGSNKFGKFSMGCEVSGAPPSAKTTPILKSSWMPTFYYLSLQGISVGPTVVPIDLTKFKVQNHSTVGMFIDVGTTLTLLEPTTFVQVTNELKHQIKLLSFNKGTGIDTQLCFNITGRTNTKKFPQIVFRFQDADFVVKPENYFNIPADQNKFGCVMMASSGFDGSVLGSYMQQNALVVYDLANNKLSFLTN